MSKNKSPRMVFNRATAKLAAGVRVWDEFPAQVDRIFELRIKEEFVAKRRLRDFFIIDKIGPGVFHVNYRFRFSRNGWVYESDYFWDDDDPVELHLATAFYGRSTESFFSGSANFAEHMLLEFGWQQVTQNSNGAMPESKSFLYKPSSVKPVHVAVDESARGEVSARRLYETGITLDACGKTSNRLVMDVSLPGDEKDFIEIERLSGVQNESENGEFGLFMTDWCVRKMRAPEPGFNESIRNDDIPF